FEIQNLKRIFEDKNNSTVIDSQIIQKNDYDKLEQELRSTKKRFDDISYELKTKDAINNKLEQEIRSLKKMLDEQIQNIQFKETDTDQLHSEIRSLKRLCDERANEIHKKECEYRLCQEYLLSKKTKYTTLDTELKTLKDQHQSTIVQLEVVKRETSTLKYHYDEKNKLYFDLEKRSHLLETKLLETMELIDSRNKTLFDYEQDMSKLKHELTLKYKELNDKQYHIQELEQMVIDKSAEIRHMSENLVEYERSNNVLSEQVEQLTEDLRLKQEELQQVQKSYTKQLNTKQDQLIRYDENLHAAEIKSNYAKEEIRLQEREISRLRTIEEEHENKIKLLQQELCTVQEHKDSAMNNFERTETELRNVKLNRDDELKRYSLEIEKLTSEIAELKVNEIQLLKQMDELNQNLSSINNERIDCKQQNKNYRTEIEHLEKVVCDETETTPKLSSKVSLLTHQLDDVQKRYQDTVKQLEDVRLQLKSSLMTNDTLKSELNHIKLLNQEYINKECEFKMNLSRSNATLDDKEKCLDDQQRELETLNHILSKLQIDYERSKTDLSLAHDNIVQYETNEHTIKQTLTEKTDELTTLSNRFHALQNDYYTYEKNHRYTNENYFDKEHRLTSVENELTTTAKNFELLQNENKILNDKLEKYRYDREQAEILEAENTEKMIQSIDEGKICKRKLAILGECFQTLVRKSSETSEKWAKAIQRLHDQFSDINEQLIKLRLIEERFEQTMKIITVLRSHYEDISLQTVALKPVIEKLYMYI
ncbi:unnamed protein product, partial [Didymodactylos carnosus]